jgi:hypothetical protein
MDRTILISTVCKTAYTSLGLALLVQGYTSRGSNLRPYTPDADTIHLWHMNDQSVPVIDMGSDGMHLPALRNGATLGNVSYRGFGTALSTYDGGPETPGDAAHDAYLAARPLVNGLGDNVVINYAGASGAFTFEAMLRIDFDPEGNFSTNSAATNHGSFLQIINLDADENTNRVCQFRFVPIGVLKSNTEPLLEFINLNKDKNPQSLTAAIPTTGPDAIRFGNWYHAAVTYDGAPDHPENFKFYWTLVDPSRAKANLIGSGVMVNELPSGCAPDFAIGQTGRQSPWTPYPNQNFPGLIDEVRISGVARSETQMLFDGQQVVAAATPVMEYTTSQPSAAEKTKVPTPGSGKPDGDSWTDKLSSASAMIAGALVIIAGLLCWLLYVLRKLVFPGSKSAKPAAIGPAPVGPAPVGPAPVGPAPVGPAPVGVAAVASAPAAPAEPTVDDILKAADSLILQATELKSRSGSTTRFKKKPAFEEVVAEEKQDGEPEVGFRGVMRRVGLEDIIQMECMNCKSTLLEISNDKLDGRIFIERGEIIHAVAGTLTGEPALQKLLALRGGEFSAAALKQPERRTIHGQWMQLLMEAAQVRDEEETSFVTADEAKGFSFTPSNSSPEEMVAVATLLGDHPHVKELVLVATEGNVLYSSKCPDSAARATACGELIEAAKNVSTHLPMGEFHHLEIVNNQSRTVIQPAQGHHLMIGTAADAANPLG